MLRMFPAGIDPWLGSMQSHKIHQSLHPLMVDPKALSPQPGRHFRTAVEWDSRVLLVKQLHQMKVQFALTLGAVVPTRTAQPQQITLPADSHLSMIRVHH